MASVDWLNVLVGGVFTAALTLLGQIGVQRYQQSLNQKMATWNTRRERADKIEMLAGHVQESLKSNNPKHHLEEAKAQLLQLLALVGDVAAYPSLAYALRGYQGYATGIAYTLDDNNGRFDSAAQRNEVFADLDSNYNALLAALQQYRDGTLTSTGLRLRKAFHLPGAVRE